MDPIDIDPALYQRDDLRATLAARDIGALYRALIATGLSQHRIAKLTGQSQSEVSEILKGRRVLTYDTLARIAQGLRVPPEQMGLSYRGPDGTSYDPTGTYPEEVTVTQPEEAEDMLRRHLLALGGVAMVGVPVEHLGELADALATPSPVPLPSRMEAVHVAQVQDLTQRLRDAGRTFGSNPELSSAAAARATQLLDLPGTDRTRRALLSAVSELHILSGWGAFDAGLYDRAMYHYTRGLELAIDGGDPYLQALALTYAGIATVDRGHPNDGLKMLQFGQVKAWDIPSGHDRRGAVLASSLEESAIALTALGQREAAARDLGKAREMWRPTQPFGDPHNVAARLELAGGRLNVAEPFAVASVRHWETTSKRAHSQARVLLATIHVRAGESDALQLAHNAITAVSKLSSVRARTCLEPLAEALTARPGSDTQELARLARQVATTRA